MIPYIHINYINQNKSFSPTCTRINVMILCIHVNYTTNQNKSFSWKFVLIVCLWAHIKKPDYVNTIPVTFDFEYFYTQTFHPQDTIMFLDHESKEFLVLKWALKSQSESYYRNGIINICILHPSPIPILGKTHYTQCFDWICMSESKEVLPFMQT